jgi:glycosyltransferase involved in cell wall biosynthesis
MESSMRISVIIPTLNEEASLGQVLGAISSAAVSEVLVVDGGSTDRTVAIARSAGAHVIREPRRGYGRACASGLQAASGEVVVFMDADGADDPACLDALAAPVQAGRADLALGSRLSGGLEAGAMPWQQHFGNWLAARLIRRLYHLPLTDLSPFRAVLRKKLLALDMREMTYGWPTEMIVKAARQGWRIVELPVAYHPRLGGKSKISGTLHGSLLATYFILRTIWRYAGDRKWQP